MPLVGPTENLSVKIAEDSALALQQVMLTKYSIVSQCAGKICFLKCYSTGQIVTMPSILAQNMNIFQNETNKISRCLQGSHYIMVLKFRDFSRTFKDHEVAFSRTNSRLKFTSWAALQAYSNI